MARITFHVEVHDEADGSLWAEVKELPGCFASGFSMEELQEALLEAIQMCLPDGVSLDSPSWDLGEDQPVASRNQKAKKREMVVCA